MINGQYWKLHMIVLFRSSWYKYHRSFRFYRVNFCYWQLHFSKSFYRYTLHVVVWMQSFANRNHKLWLVGAETVSPIFCQILRISWQRSYCDATRALCDVTVMSRALGVPPATLGRVCCEATATCFRDDLTALVLSMFKTWRRPRRPWRPYCDLQRCHGALWDLTTTQRRSAAIWPILQIAARSPSCVTGVLVWWRQMHCRIL